MSRCTPLALALAAVALAACSAHHPEHAPPPSHSPSPVRTATPEARQFIVTSAVPAVTVAPAAPATVRVPVVSIKATVAPKPSATPADPPPRILSVALSESTVHSGDVVSERVVASPNTASIEARIGGYSISLPKTGTGTFTLNYKVPFVPFFLHGGYDVLLIARNTEGVQSRRVTHITVQ